LGQRGGLKVALTSKRHKLLTMQQSSRPSPSYALTLRVEYGNSLGMLGRITSTIGEHGGDIGAIDIVKSTRQTITRDITFSAANYEHGREIIGAVRGIGNVDIVHVSDRTFLMHLGGKIEVRSKVPLKTRDDLSMAYLPGVARIAQAIVDDPQDVFNLTIKKNSVAVVSDGSSVINLGDVGPFAALPVMESKAILLKEFAGIDAFPVCLDATDEDAFVAAVKAIAPTFGAIHLEDIKSPRCFDIERQLDEELDIAVMHNDQHGTAIVILAALINSLKIIEKPLSTLRVVINGTGAASTATAKLLKCYGVSNIVVREESGVPEALQGADVFIGFGRRTTLQPEHIAAMNSDAIVFMSAHPRPEIEPELIADKARIIATGRSDYPNQINNMLCFPGFFRGLLDARARGVNDEMKLAAADAIAEVIGRDELHEDHVIPGIFDRRVVGAVALAVAESARQTGMARRSGKAPA